MPLSCYFGAREGNRTLDLRITSALLCRLSYPGLCRCFLAQGDGGKVAKSHAGSVADLLDRWLDDACTEDCRAAGCPLPVCGGTTRSFLRH